MTDPTSVWSLDPDVVHLNHGSFGATPVAVLAAQDELRRAMERNPIAFMEEAYQPAIEASRAALGSFLGADPAGLVFVRNATEGSNAVLQSLARDLGPGTNIVITSHTYNALANTVDLIASLTGAERRTATMPFPVESARTCVEAVLGAIDENTALVVIDHVTSPTGLVLDIRAIIDECEPAVPVLVDGAHAPGMVPLDLDQMGASFYVGNCHKWLCAPKGSGFLAVAERFRSRIRPPTVSHGMNDRYPYSGSAFHSRFDWTGTDDRTPWMVVPTALATVGGLSPDGWPGVMTANRDLALIGRDILADALGRPPAAPDDMIGALAALVPIPHSDPPALKLAIRRRHGIEFGLTPWADAMIVRASAQLYNSPDDYQRLAAALISELE